MRIAKVEDFQLDGGVKPLSFLKITTDTGLVGWGEYSEFTGSVGLSGLVRAMGESVIGFDPNDTNRIVNHFVATGRSAPGGLHTQASAAIENAYLDIKGKHLGVPVYQLFGGAVRERIKVYWSHVGTYRARAHGVLGVPPLQSYDDFKMLGRQVRDRGISGFKTNVITFLDGKARTYTPTFGVGRGHPDRGLYSDVMESAVQQLTALREGAGDEIEIMLDVLTNFRPEALVRFAKGLEGFKLRWIETDIFDPDALLDIKRRVSTPIASGEALYGRTEYLPFLAKRAADVVVVDPMWNGFTESVKIADLADLYDMPVSSHAYTSPWATMLSAHFCAVIANFSYLEMDFEEAPWVVDLFDMKPVLKGGMLVLPDKPGWGIDIVEEALRGHAKIAAPRSSGY